MRKSKFSETQIVAMPKDAESGISVADLHAKHGGEVGSRDAACSSQAASSIAALRRLHYEDYLQHPGALSGAAIRQSEAAPPGSFPFWSDMHARFTLGFSSGDHL